MKTRGMILTLALCFAGAVACFAGDANMGTWKLNDAKSQMTAGMPKNSMVKYEAAGDSIKVTVDGTGADGQPSHNEWTGKFDGKDYPVTGDPTSDTRAYTKVDDNTLDLTSKKGGKVTTTGRISVAPDGKTRTIVVSGTDAQGNKFNNTGVYDRQ
jgi:FlaG/FlaF family flagellin (archaellin)